jgi:hypothetical protein
VVEAREHTEEVGGGCGRIGTEGTFLWGLGEDAPEFKHLRYGGLGSFSSCVGRTERMSYDKSKDQVSRADDAYLVLREIDKSNACYKSVCWYTMACPL